MNPFKPGRGHKVPALTLNVFYFLICKQKVPIFVTFLKFIWELLVIHFFAEMFNFWIIELFFCWF